MHSSDAPRNAIRTDSIAAIRRRSLTKPSLEERQDHARRASPHAVHTPPTVSVAASRCMARRAMLLALPDARPFSLRCGSRAHLTRMAKAPRRRRTTVLGASRRPYPMVQSSRGPQPGSTLPRESPCCSSSRRRPYRPRRVPFRSTLRLRAAKLVGRTLGTFALSARAVGCTHRRTFCDVHLPAMTGTPGRPAPRVGACSCAWWALRPRSG